MSEENTPAPSARKASGKAAPAASPEMKTPEQWAEQKGELVRADPRLPQSQMHYRWRHAAANALFGWSQHAYHHGATEPLLLTESDYDDALAIAAAYPAQPEGMTDTPDIASMVRQWSERAFKRRAEQEKV